jgi:hypothetical protein
MTGIVFPAGTVEFFCFSVLPEWIWSPFNLILSGLVGTDSSIVGVKQLEFEAGHLL